MISFIENLEKLSNRLKVLVVGDLILDKYLFTDVNRVSPEAPVPVARFSHEKSYVGGAGNVAYNVSKYVDEVYFIGQKGNDLEGDKLTDIFDEKNIIFSPVIIDENTITKTRIISRNSQLIRLDFEKSNLEIESNLVISKIKYLIDKVDLVIVSDYNKGLISKGVLDYLRKVNKYVSLDVKPGRFESFENISLVKPNFSEAVSLAKQKNSKLSFENTDKNVEELGYFLSKEYKANFLITRSENGASYIGEEIVHNKIEISELRDVTGAGDTCISLFSLCDYLNLDLSKSLLLMNLAAKISIRHIGTYSPSFMELKNEIEKEEFDNIISKEKIGDILPSLRAKNKRIVFTNGCFDLIHKGHVDYLNKAKKTGDILIVGINSDESIKRLKGSSRPIIDEDSRAFVLSNLKSVDYVIVFDEGTPENLLEIIKPDYLVKGGDYELSEVVGKSYVESYGGCVKTIPVSKKDEHSTSTIIDKIKDLGDDK